MLELIYPPNRIQALLASAAGEESWEPDYTTLEAPRIELYLRKINGEDVQLPEYPVTTIEKFLAYKCGEEVELPEPVTRLEMLLAKDTPVEPAELPEPQTMIEYYVLNMQAGGGGVEKTESGEAPLTIEALAHAIVSLTQNGKVTQASTHTPSSPADIVCNNGALKMVDDELPTGYKRVLGFECNNNAMWEITGFNLKGSDTVRISFSVEAACNVWGCYQGTDATDNYDLYASISAGSKYLRYGNGTYLSYWSPDDLGQRFDVVYTPNGSQGMPQDSTWSPRTFTSANDLLIGSTTVGGTSSKLKGNLYGNVVVDGRLKLIPCERVSDNVLGYYDTYSETFYEPYEGYDGAVSLGYDGSHYSLATVGTPEVLSVTADGATPQTASVADLFAVGDYKDTHELISGAVTRRVGIKVLNGTESISGGQTIGSLINPKISISNAVSGTKSVICSHFKDGQMTQDAIKLESKKATFYVALADFPNNSAFGTWLAAQYAQGTPVIIVYPLATETTETVAGQHLTTAEGTNTVSVTSNVDPVTLTVVYKGTDDGGGSIGGDDDPGEVPMD